MTEEFQDILNRNSEALNTLNDTDDYEKFEAHELPLPSKKSKFKANYGLYTLVMLGFGNTIGSGVFTLTGVASKFAG